MRRPILAQTVLALAGLVLLCLAGTARAQGAGDRAAIEAVISDQMAAFGRDDGEAAFSFATPELRGMFGDAGRFMTMVRQGYQPVYRPRSVTFGELTEQDGQTVQEVGVIGPDGAPRVAVYTMERQPDGSWRIAGCRLVERPNAGS